MRTLAALGCVFIAYSAHVRGSTPLCNVCDCTSQPNQPVTINCVAANIPDIYNEKLWIDEFSESYRIESLTLQYNQLRKLKAKFPFSDLTKLDLSHNLIDDIGFGTFSQLQNMRVLVLSHNNIERLHPDSFKGVYEKSHYFPLRSLKKLDLQYNKIHSLHPDTFEHIDDIQDLNLSHNPFYVIDAQTLQAIASLVYLSILNLSYTQIKTLPTYFLHAPKYLTHLDLSGNYFATIPDALQYSQSLTTLYLNKNPVRNLSSNVAFPRVPTLKSLHMTHMLHLQSIGAQSFSGVPNLEELCLSKNKFFSNIHPDALLVDDTTLGSPKYLRLLKLSLDNNNLSVINESLLPEWEKLEKLHLDGNPWVCDCTNEWLIKDLVPLVAKLNHNHMRNLKCASPDEMQNQTLYDVYEQQVANDGFCKGETTFKTIFILYMAIGVLGLGVVLFLVVFYKDRLRNLVCGAKFYTLPTSEW